MDNSKFANLANSNLSQIKPDKKRGVKKSLIEIIKEFNIKNGSFKVYVRDGLPSERIEIQTHYRTEI